MTQYTGGRYMSAGSDNSENVRLCMRFSDKESSSKYNLERSKSFSTQLPPAPYANRSTDGFIGAGPFLPQRHVGIPSYCSTKDPSLEEYFCRKSSRILSPQLPLRDIYHSALEADKLRLRTPSIKTTKSGYLSQKNEVLYKVAVTTADVHGAGTQIPVFISIRGDRANLPRTKLTKQTKSNRKKTPVKFNPGSTQIFPIKCPDLGELESLLIEHDGLEPNDSWLLQGIEIINTENQKIWLFTCNHWLSLYKEDGRVSRELFAFKSMKTKYEIVVVTGDVTDAETDSQVYIALCGRTGVSPQLHLRNENSSCFKKGQSSRFVISATCVGPITKIRIRQDESGSKPNWYLDRICITDLKHPQWRYFFQCKNWLSSSIGDGAVAREIRGTKEITGIATRTEYKISIYTANKPGAGTRADVFLQIFGEIGESDVIIVRNPEGFREGSVFEHRVPMKQLGSLKEIRIGHTNKGPQPIWLLDKVIISDVGLSRVFEFPCGMWFSDTNDEKLIRLLKVKQGFSGGPKFSYEMKVTTANRSKASSSSKVYVVLTGPEPKNKVKDKVQSSGKIWIQGAQLAKGRTDVVVLELDQLLSPLTQLSAGISPAGNKPDWFLEDIVILCHKTGIEQSFICGNWLSASREGCTQEVLLVEDVSKRKMKETKDRWIIRVHTSNITDAGTHAKVVMVLYGSDGKTDDIVFPSDKQLDRNSVEEFQIDLEQIGLPYKLRVQHDNSGHNPSWHVNKIVMTHAPTSDFYEFKCDRWLSETHDDKSIVREIPAMGPGIKKVAPVCTYKIQVFTGNKLYAGTDANVFINVYGDLGDFGDRFLIHSNNKKKFEKNQMDEFVMEAVKLGTINKIKLGHDSKLPGSGWFVDKVIVWEEENRANCVTFRLNCWFDSSEGDGLTVREITATPMLGQVTYEVIVKTGKEPGAGTDANVFIRIFGSAGDTGKVQLKTSSTSKNKFEHAATDVFKLESEDIGEIKSIRLSQDNTGAASAWLVNEVVIIVTKLGLKYVFSLNKWLDKNVPEIDADPTKVEKIDRTTPYQVTVFTGDVLNAGTDAKVFIQIYGKKSKTEEIVLKSRSNAFERGNEDLFKIDGTDVGNIQKIRIGHNGKKPGAGWFLDKVLIEKAATVVEDVKKKKKSSSPKKRDRFSSRRSNASSDRGSSSSDEDSIIVKKSEPDNEDSVERYWFFAKRWFAADEDDGMIVRELLATDEHGKPLTDLEEFEYKVSVKTGKKNGAGTDANVFITIYGKDSDSGERALKKPIQSTVNKFEQDSLDTFSVKAIELGSLEKIKIRHDNAGGGSAWYLDYVLINDNYNEYLFPCFSWLAKEKGDGLISRDIFVANPEMHNDWKNGTLTEDKFKIYQEDKLEKYEVNVYTTKKSMAGTDANVHIVLCGENSDSGLIALKNSLTHANKFESGQCDKFIVKSADIGELKKIKIGHDNTLGGADWHLEKVEVEALKLGQKWVFPCNDWISKKKGDGKLEKVLYPHSELTIQKRPRVTYEVTTHTSDIGGAGTSANVYIQIYGKHDCTEQRFLANEIERPNKFKKGAVNTFYLEMEDVEDPIEKIRIGHDGKGISAGWHLTKVIVKRLMPDKSKSIAYQFPCNRWLARNEDDHAIERELIADQIMRKQFSAKDGKTIETVDENVNLSQLKKYVIRVYTGDETGTNANVYLKVFGDNGDTGERQLTDSKTHMDKFERNNMDEFEWEAVDLGKLQKIDIRHDNSGLIKKDWFLKKVEVLDLYDNEKYMFHCERWLSKSKEDKRIQRTVYAQGYDGDRSPSSLSRSRTTLSGSVGSTESLNSDSKSGTFKFENDTDTFDGKAGLIPYTITVKTGPEKEMGSSGPFWVRFYGPKETKTRRIRLQKIGSDYFSPNSKETMSVEAVDVSNITQIEVTNEGVEKESGWYLKSISVAMPTKGKSYHVPCATWLSRFHGEKKNSRIFNVVDKMTSKFAPKVTYDLTVYTGDCESAGTDSTIFIQLFGTRGTSPMYPLEKVMDNFERGHRDMVKLEMEDVGEITKIRVQNDGKGDRPHWFLEKIEIRSEKLKNVREFIFNDYLSKQLGQTKLLVVDIVPSDIKIKTTSYNVFVKTSKVKSANTSAAVFIKLYGDQGDSGELALNKPDKSGKLFQVDQLNEFVFTDIMSLGDLSRCQVWHNCAGFSASWHLEYIEVRESNSRRMWKFQCDKWLSQTEGDKQIFRELICDSSPDSNKRLQKETVYEVTVTTGDKNNAGMPDDVWIVFNGTKDYSDDCLMVNSAKNKLFSKGNVDQMKHTSNYLGDLKDIVIGAVKNRKSDVHRAKWYCHEIQVKDLTTLKTYIFEIRDWIQIHDTIDKKKGKIFVPSKVEENSAKLKATEIRKKGVVRYEVLVVTGKEFGSGTNANIFITLYGDNVDSGQRPLVQKGRDLFERGQEDRFVIESADLGDINKVKIEHDDSGIRSDWLLDRIQITNQSTNKVWRFECGEWLSKDKGDKKLWKILIPS